LRDIGLLEKYFKMDIDCKLFFTRSGKNPKGGLIRKKYGSIKQKK
jgi:hypothetical protein